MNTAIPIEAAEPDRPESLPLSSWESKPVDWLWEPYLAKGMITLLTGSTGAGKTCIALDIAAAVTGGRRTDPANVLYLSAGDNPEYVLRPRFEACGGDARRLLVARAPLATTKSKAGQLGATGALAVLIEEHAAALVVVDPLHSYTDPHYRRQARIRAALQALALLAEQKHCAILLVHARSKSGDAPAAEFDMTRSVLLAGELPENPARRALVHLRSNCSLPGPTLSYTIEENGALRWTGETRLAAWNLLQPEPTPEEMSALKTAQEFLLAELEHGPREIRFVKMEAKRVLITEHTLRRARERLEVNSWREGSDWFWELPAKAAECKPA